MSVFLYIYRCVLCMHAYIYAYKRVNFQPLLAGSSTACVVVLQGEAGQLYSANIGDSGFLVVRDGSVVHRSQEQQHYFNTPFQLSLPPPGTNAQVLSDRSVSMVEGEQGETIDVFFYAVFISLLCPAIRYFCIRDSYLDNFPVGCLNSQFHMPMTTIS